MNHERDTRRTDRDSARTNTGRTATANCVAHGDSLDGRRTADQRRRGSRAGSAGEGATVGEPSGGEGADADRDGPFLPGAVYREGRTVTANGPSREVIEGFLKEVYRNTPPVDGVIVLTTERSASEVLETHLAGADEKRAPIGMIDTRSAGQYVEDVYRESPVHYTTADGDIERTALSVAELVETLSTSPAGRVHLIVDSYAALCESLPPQDRARLLNTVHSQVDGYGIYVTDDADDVLGDWADGSVRVEGTTENGIRTRYERP